MSAEFSELQSVSLASGGLRYFKIGSGRPILFLHPEIGMRGSEALLRELAKFGTVFAPIHPGYGDEPRPPYVTTVDDIAYAYLDFIEKLGLANALVVGVSLGAWLAAEIATKNCAMMSALVLISPVGIKPAGGPEMEIFDIFGLHWNDVGELLFHDRSKIANPSGDIHLDSARAREATALYAWQPYMQNPKLISRLHRITCPTLCLSADRDRMISRNYVQAFADRLPRGAIGEIADAGHFPHIEQPEAVVAAISRFEAALGGEKVHPGTERQ